MSAFIKYMIVLMCLSVVGSCSDSSKSDAEAGEGSQKTEKVSSGETHSDDLGEKPEQANSTDGSIGSESSSDEVAKKASEQQDSEGGDANEEGGEASDGEQEEPMSGNKSQPEVVGGGNNVELTEIDKPFCAGDQQLHAELVESDGVQDIVFNYKSKYVATGNPSFTLIQTGVSAEGDLPSEKQMRFFEVESDRDLCAKVTWSNIDLAKGYYKISYRLHNRELASHKFEVKREQVCDIEGLKDAKVPTLTLSSDSVRSDDGKLEVFYSGLKHDARHTVSIRLRDSNKRSFLNTVIPAGRPCGKQTYTITANSNFSEGENSVVIEKDGTVLVSKPLMYERILTCSIESLRDHKEPFMQFEEGDNPDTMKVSVAGLKYPPKALKFYNFGEEVWDPSKEFTKGFYTFVSNFRSSDGNACAVVEVTTKALSTGNYAVLLEMHGAGADFIKPYHHTSEGICEIDELRSLTQPMIEIFGDKTDMKFLDYRFGGIDPTVSASIMVAFYHLDLGFVPRRARRSLPSNYRCGTDSEAFFFISGIPNGRYKLLFSKGSFSYPESVIASSEEFVRARALTCDIEALKAITSPTIRADKQQYKVGETVTLSLAGLLGGDIGEIEVRKRDNTSAFPDKTIRLDSGVVNLSCYEYPLTLGDLKAGVYDIIYKFSGLRGDMSTLPDVSASITVVE